MEIWNLVFMQYNRAVKDGPLEPLPAPCVDTGMGLERITAVLQGVTTNYDTDLLRPLVERAARIAGRPYTGADSAYDVGCRVQADHARMAAIALAEGITPSNKDRGAALRSVMRRAIRHAYLQGLRTPTLHTMVEGAIEGLGNAYPELVQHKDFILEQCRAEDHRFRETIPTGLGLLEKFDGWASDASGTRVLPSAVAFDLQHRRLRLPPRPHRGARPRARLRSVDLAGYTAARERHSELSKGDEDSAGVSKEERVRPGAPARSSRPWAAPYTSRATTTPRAPSHVGWPCSPRAPATRSPASTRSKPAPWGSSSPPRRPSTARPAARWAT